MFDHCICDEPDEYLVLLVSEDRAAGEIVDGDKVKVLRCCECHEMIKPGEIHHVEIGTTGGDVEVQVGEEWICAEINDDDDLLGALEEHPELRDRLEWQTFVTCSTCYRVRVDLMSCGWTWGRLWERIAEHYGEECV